MKKVEVKVRVKYPVGYSCRAFGEITGTPTEVVKIMFENRSPFLPIKSLKEYVPEMVKRAKAMSGVKGTIRSKNPKQYALTFLKIMNRAGFIKILPSRR